MENQTFTNQTSANQEPMTMAEPTLATTIGKCRRILTFDGICIFLWDAPKSTIFAKNFEILVEYCIKGVPGNTVQQLPDRDM